MRLLQSVRLLEHAYFERLSDVVLVALLEVGLHLSLLLGPLKADCEETPRHGGRPVIDLCLVV